MKYTIDFKNSGIRMSAASLAQAKRMMKSHLGVARIYRGAEFETDRPVQGSLGWGDEFCTAVEYWDTRDGATRQTNGHADAVISWA